MKSDWQHLEDFRLVETQFATCRGDKFGMFIFCYPNHQIRAMACDGEETGWEHVSVSVSCKAGKKVWTRMPTWEEMCFMKDQFWGDEETVMQLHPPKSEWINNHPHCLHLWRSTNQEIPLPPSIFVGLKELNI